jgi:hypothetical protein
MRGKECEFRRGMWNRADVDITDSGGFLMRKTMRTAFVTAAVVGLGLSGAAAAQADGEFAFDNDKQADSSATVGKAYQTPFSQGVTWGASSNSISDNSAGAGSMG